MIGSSALTPATGCNEISLDGLKFYIGDSSCNKFNFFADEHKSQFHWKVHMSLLIFKKGIKVNINNYWLVPTSKVLVRVALFTGLVSRNQLIN